jgi:GNAT superfamily N-acetyltransferase
VRVGKLSRQRTMPRQIECADFKDLAQMRELYRREMNCQIIHDSFARRGLSDPYVARIDGAIAGYVAVSNKYDKGRLNEFYLLPEYRGSVAEIFRELLVTSGATHIEAQTNALLLDTMIRQFGTNIFTEKILFDEGTTTHMPTPCGGVFRKRTEADGRGQFEQEGEALADWIVEANGEIVAAGGFLTHYNPPYGDVFMEVAESARRQGFGSYIVQEIKTVCYQAGKKPAARCNVANIASRKTLEKAGMRVCGELLVGEVKELSREKQVFL